MNSTNERPTITFSRPHEGTERGGVLYADPNDIDYQAKLFESAGYDVSITLPDTDLVLLDPEPVPDPVPLVPEPVVEQPPKLPAVTNLGSTVEHFYFGVGVVVEPKYGYEGYIHVKFGDEFGVEAKLFLPETDKLFMPLIPSVKL